MIPIGLDQYLSIKKHLYAFRSTAAEVTRQKTGIQKLFPILNTLEPEEVVFKFGYWRKANHIHKWFVDNVQNGQDDCKKYWVEPAKLKELRYLCAKSLDLHKLGNDEDASELLPPTEGFFFGGTEIDSYYWDATQDTLDLLNQIDFEEPDPAVKLVSKIEGAKIPVSECDFEYQSSW